MECNPNTFPTCSQLDVEHPQTFTNHTLPLIFILQSAWSHKSHFIFYWTFPIKWKKTYGAFKIFSSKSRSPSAKKFSGLNRKPSSVSRISPAEEFGLQNSFTGSPLRSNLQVWSTCTQEVSHTKVKEARVWKKAVTNMLFWVYVENIWDHVLAPGPAMYNR